MRRLFAHFFRSFWLPRDKRSRLLQYSIIHPIQFYSYPFIFPSFLFFYSSFSLNGSARPTETRAESFLFRRIEKYLNISRWLPTFSFFHAPSADQFDQPVSLITAPIIWFRDNARSPKARVVGEPGIFGSRCRFYPHRVAILVSGCQYLRGRKGLSLPFFC